MNTLIDPRDLAVRLTDPAWVVLDCRHDLSDPAAGRAAYARGHIPGARFAGVDAELCGLRTGRNGRHPLPEAAAAAAALGALGVSASSRVVAYDAQGGMFAARLWWMLRWLGHDAVAVLDGGWQRWLAEIRLTATDVPTLAAATFTPRPRPVNVDAAAVAAHVRHPGQVLVDARAPDRFRGENEKLDPVGGHVPGAVNRYFMDNLADGRFKPAATLEAEWRAVLGSAAPASVVHMCGSGVSACHNLLALEVAGLGGGRLYPGSWSEWCADPARPVATGRP